MAINRRQFIKRSAGAVSVSLIMPRFWMGGVARGQEVAADPNRKIFVVIQLGGGCDGLNTVVPYAEAAYRQLRPTIALPAPRGGSREAALDLDGFFGLHPALEPLLPLWTDKTLGIVHAVVTSSPNAFIESG